MDIDWSNIYAAYNEGEQRKMKFQILPKSLPWAGDFQENVDLTLEWLIREGKADDVRLAEEPVVNIVSNQWYTIESEPGRFVHVCYPQEMLKFRGQFESMRERLVMSFDIQLNIEAARTQLWSAWNCIGGDGKRVEPGYDSDSLDGEDLTPVVPYLDWPREWNYRCFKCCEDLPKNLKLWQKLQHGKLKGI